jgi:hypothetical protein
MSSEVADVKVTLKLLEDGKCQFFNHTDTEETGELLNKDENCRWFIKNKKFEMEFDENYAPKSSELK